MVIYRNSKRISAAHHVDFGAGLGGADGEEVVQGPEDRPADDEDGVVEHREVVDTKPLKGRQETVVSRSIYNFKT